MGREVREEGGERRRGERGKSLPSAVTTLYLIPDALI